jgi:multicomponent K+:H+ antiporter subunit A
MDTSVLPIIILLPLILGTTLVALLQRFSREATALGAIAVSLTCFGLLLTQAKQILLVQPFYKAGTGYHNLD